MTNSHILKPGPRKNGLDSSVWPPLDFELYSTVRK